MHLSAKRRCKMKTFNELLVTNKNELTEAENEFLRKHEEILFSGSTASA